jgi:ADP-ribose pyrophosphatase YjhB (NUDIX family)
MNLFINGMHIVLKPQIEEVDTTIFEVVLDLKETIIKYNNLRGNILIKNAQEKDVQELLQLALGHKFEQIDCVELRVSDFKVVKQMVKNSFKILQAAGGLVKRKNTEEFLLMYRLEKWDFPKGKLDSGEKFKAAALREVEEECNVKVKSKEKICTTWHNYTMGRTQILKQTRWYLMDCLDESKMKPQKSESIEELAWMEDTQIMESLKNSYESIRYVYEAYKDSLFK